MQEQETIFTIHTFLKFKHIAKQDVELQTQSSVYLIASGETQDKNLDAYQIENNDDIQFLGTQQVFPPSKQAPSQTQVPTVGYLACSLSEYSTSSLLNLDNLEVCVELSQKPSLLYSFSQNISINHLPTTSFTNTRRAQEIRKKSRAQLVWELQQAAKLAVKKARSKTKKEADGQKQEQAATGA